MSLSVDSTGASVAEVAALLTIPVERIRRGPEPKRGDVRDGRPKEADWELSIGYPDRRTFTYLLPAPWTHDPVRLRSFVGYVQSTLGEDIYPPAFTTRTCRSLRAALWSADPTPPPVDNRQPKLRNMKRKEKEP